MSAHRPPLDDVPLFAACPRCRGVLRARVDFTATPVEGRLPCPWCRSHIRVVAPG